MILQVICKTVTKAFWVWFFPGNSGSRELQAWSSAEFPPIIMEQAFSFELRGNFTSFRCGKEKMKSDC